MSGGNRSTITPEAGGRPDRSSVGTLANPPRSPGLPRSRGLNAQGIAASANPPAGALGASMYCSTPKKLASVVGPMIALQLGKDPAEISDLLAKYLSSHTLILIAVGNRLLTYAMVFGQ